MILHLIHVPWPDGPIKDLRSAWRAGRALAYALRFEEFESHARDELTRILGPGGFDADRDIAAITVNRWGHGYAYDANSLYDDASFAERERDVLLGFGPVAGLQVALGLLMIHIPLAVPSLDVRGGPRRRADAEPEQP